MNPADIITRLQAHEADHEAHNELVYSWLRDAGFHPLVNPCRVALHFKSALGVWCGNATRHATRAIEISATPTDAQARVVSYGGQRIYVTASGATPVEALCALVATGKVPETLLR